MSSSQIPCSTFEAIEREQNPQKRKEMLDNVREQIEMQSVSLQIKLEERRDEREKRQDKREEHREQRETEYVKRSLYLLLYFAHHCDCGTRGHNSQFHLHQKCSCR